MATDERIRPPLLATDFDYRDSEPYSEEKERLRENHGLRGFELVEALVRDDASSSHPSLAALSSPNSAPRVGGHGRAPSA